MQITQDELKNMGNNTPTYKFVEVSDDLSPMKTPIAKIRETAETFSMFDILTYEANMEKQIKEKEAELAGLKTMREKFQEEKQLIEDALHISELEETYRVENEVPVDDSDTNTTPDANEDGGSN